MYLFAGLSLDSTIPNHTTIMNFKHLLKKHKLSRQLFIEINKWLSSTGIYLKDGTIVDTANRCESLVNVVKPKMLIDLNQKVYEQIWILTNNQPRMMRHQRNGEVRSTLKYMRNMVSP